MLHIDATYDCLQFQGKRMTKLKKNCRKPHFWSNSDQLVSVCRNVIHSDVLVIFIIYIYTYYSEGFFL